MPHLRLAVLGNPDRLTAVMRAPGTRLPAQTGSLSVHAPVHPRIPGADVHGPAGDDAGDELLGRPRC